MTHCKFNWQQTRTLVDQITVRYPLNTRYYGIPRGGSYIAALTGNPVDSPEEADVIVDDICETGATAKKYEQYKKPIEFAIDKRTANEAVRASWIVWPWESGSLQDAEDSVRRLLQAVGEDTTREGLLDTPKRHVKYLNEFLSPKEFMLTTFKNDRMDSMIIESPIPFFSLCEHHLLPFFGHAAIAYIPNEQIVGLSKLARVLDKFSRRLQTQEYITTQVADYIMEQLKPKGVAVQLRARHLCMEMRGVCKHDVYTTTSDMRGVFNNINTRNEFLQLANAH